MVKLVAVALIMIGAILEFIEGYRSKPKFSVNPRYIAGTLFAIAGLLLALS